MKTLLLCLMMLVAWSVAAQQPADRNNYLSDIKVELKKAFPDNRTVNLVFHGHSVPAGYYDTPDVRTLDAYPFTSLRLIKRMYPYAVMNSIVTAIGGENSVRGAARFRDDVLCHKPDVLFIDYSLNDIGVGLEKAREAWEQMIAQALDYGCKVILMTPSPDLRYDMEDPNNPLAQHAQQIRDLAARYQVGLVDSYAVFEAVEKGGEFEIKEYMSHVNHPNYPGHEVIGYHIALWFE